MKSLKSLINHSKPVLTSKIGLGTLSILTALSLGSVGAAEPQGCDQQSADDLYAQGAVGTTTTTAADLAIQNNANGGNANGNVASNANNADQNANQSGNGANANGADSTTNNVNSNNGGNGNNAGAQTAQNNAPAATDPDPTTSTNAGYGSMQMPNPRTPLTSYSAYDLQDQSGAGGGGYTPANSSYVVPQASYPQQPYSSAVNNGARVDNVNAANQVINSGANGTVAPIETNGYGVTPAVSGSGARVSTANSEPGSYLNQSYTAYGNGIRNYSSAADQPSVSTPAAQASPFRSQPTALQAQQQGVTVGGGGRR